MSDVRRSHKLNITQPETIEEEQKEGDICMR